MARNTEGTETGRKTGQGSRVSNRTWWIGGGLLLLLIIAASIFSYIGNHPSQAASTNQATDDSGIGGNGGGSSGSNSAGASNTNANSDKEETFDGITVKGLTIVNKDIYETKPNLKLNTLYVKKHPNDVRMYFIIDRDNLPTNLELNFFGNSIKNFRTAYGNLLLADTKASGTNILTMKGESVSEGKFYSGDIEGGGDNLLSGDGNIITNFLPKEKYILVRINTVIAKGT